MLIKIITVGKIKDKHFLAKINEFVKRISFDAKLEMVELKDSNKEAEGKKLVELISKESHSYVFAMSEEGQEFTSRQFAGKIEKIHKKLVFVIGGPFGLTEEVKKVANETFSLSKMTLTHEMAKLFLAEQVFRAISIIKKRGYHND